MSVKDIGYLFNPGALDRKQAEADQFENAYAGATTQAEKDAIIRDYYAKDPSKVKQFVTNLGRRLVGKKPQAAPAPSYAAPSVDTTTGGVTNPETGERVYSGQPVTVKGPAPRTKQEALSAHAARGTTPEQQQQERQLATVQGAGDIQNRQAQQQEQASRQAVIDLIKQYVPVEQQGAALEDYARKQAGIASTLRNLPGAAGQPVETTPGSGIYARPLQNADGDIVMQPMPAGWKPPEAKPGSPGSQYMRALVKKASGGQLTPEDEAILKSYPEYVRQTSVIPAVARAAAFGQNKPQVVINPDNPQQTMVVTAGQAEKGGYATPQSIFYQMDVAGHRAQIPRNLGQNLASLQTAQDHLQMMIGDPATGQPGLIDALDNGNYPLFNALALRWAQATGDPAPTDFDTLKTALEGEMARAYTGVGATTQEIAQIGQTIDRANSPKQLKQAMATAKAAMDQRQKNLWKQVQNATNVPLVPQNGPAPKKGQPSASADPLGVLQ